MSALSPTLSLPLLDARCSACPKEDAYRMVGSCYNCSTEVVALFSFGHETHRSIARSCPACGCRAFSWRGLEDVVAAERES